MAGLGCRRPEQSAAIRWRAAIVLLVLLLGLRAGDRVRFRQTAEGAVVVEPETTDLMDLFGSLSPPGGRHVTVEEMKEAIRRAASRSGTKK